VTGKNRMVAASLMLIVGSGTWASTPSVSEELQAAEAAMGTEQARSAVRSISWVAACHGPKGDYETRVVSARGGNLSFRQCLPDHENVEGVLDGRGWSLTRDGEPETIDAVEVAILRDHDFPLMALDLTKRFHGFGPVRRTQFEGRPAIKIAMSDELGRAATAYLSAESHLPMAIVKTPSGRGATQTVTIRFDAWRLIGDVQVVSHATILMGAQSWGFDLRTIEINAASDKEFEIPARMDARRDGKCWLE
jgi:hypothetical protein